MEGGLLTHVPLHIRTSQHHLCPTETKLRINFSGSIPLSEYEKFELLVL